MSWAGDPDPRTRERLADAVVHFVGLSLGAAGSVALAALAIPRSDAQLLIAVGLYAGGLLCMFGCSALHNLSSRSPRSGWLRRLDHAAIFLMIAGTYTPFTLIAMGGVWGWTLLTFVWGMAAFGMAAKLLRPQRFERAAIVLYLLMGWCILVAVEPLSESVSFVGIALLASGGALYTTGVIFHLRKELPFQNVIWHFFVLAGAACHYAAVFREVAAA